MSDSSPRLYQKHTEKKVVEMFTQFGFAGLGSQAAPMVRRMIEAGLPVTLWARRAEALEPFAASAVSLTVTLEELAKKVT